MRFDRADQAADAALGDALKAGFPICAQTVLERLGHGVDRATRAAKSYAKSGRAEYVRKGALDWLVPLSPVLDYEEYAVMVSADLMTMLKRCGELRIFTRAHVCSDAKDERLFKDLWRMDLVEHVGNGNGAKTFEIGGRGRKVIAAAEQYGARGGPGDLISSDGDLSRFHKVIDL